MAEGILFKLFPKIHLLPRPSMENFSPKGSLVGKLPELMKTERHKRSLCVALTIVVTGAHIEREEGPYSIAPLLSLFYHQYGWDLDLKWSPDRKHLVCEYNLGNDISSGERWDLLPAALAHSFVHSFIHSVTLKCLLTACNVCGTVTDGKFMVVLYS